MNKVIIFLSVVAVAFCYDAPYAAPHSEYGVPNAYKILAAPVKSSYNFDIPAVVPHSEYGVPAPAPYAARIEPVYYTPSKPIKTSYNYEIPAELKSTPYPSRSEIIVVPHQEYGVPVVKSSPYEARIEYSAPSNPIKTSYNYEIPAEYKIKPAPYAAHSEVIVVPHQEYGVPLVKYSAPSTPIKTSYNFEIPAESEFKSAPYASRSEEIIVVPHQEYGVPHKVYGVPAL